MCPGAKSPKNEDVRTNNWRRTHSVLNQIQPGRFRIPWKYHENTPKLDGYTQTDQAEFFHDRCRGTVDELKLSGTNILLAAIEATGNIDPCDPCDPCWSMFTMFGPFCTICLRVASEDWAGSNLGTAIGYTGCASLVQLENRQQLLPQIASGWLRAARIARMAMVNPWRSQVSSTNHPLESHLATLFGCNED